MRCISNVADTAVATVSEMCYIVINVSWPTTCYFVTIHQNVTMFGPFRNVCNTRLCYVVSTFTARAVWHHTTAYHQHPISIVDVNSILLVPASHVCEFFT